MSETHFSHAYRELIGNDLPAEPSQPLDAKDKQAFGGTAIIGLIGYTIMYLLILLYF